MSTSATITVRVNPLEHKALKYLAKVEGKPISTILKKIAIAKAENDYYYNLGMAARREHLEDGQTYTLDEVISHIGK